MNDEDEYGHHPPGYDPRGADFDHPTSDPATPHDPEQPCEVCGEVHGRGVHSPE